MLSVTSPTSASEFDYAVLGFHQYQSIWTPVVDKELCKCEVHNLHTWWLIRCSGYRRIITLVLVRILVFTDTIVELQCCRVEKFNAGNVVNLK